MGQNRGRESDGKGGNGPDFGGEDCLSIPDFQLPIVLSVCQFVVISLNTMQISRVFPCSCHGLHSQPSVLAGFPTASDGAFIGTPAIGSGTRPPTKGGSLG